MVADGKHVEPSKDDRCYVVPGPLRADAYALYVLCRPLCVIYAKWENGN